MTITRNYLLYTLMLIAGAIVTVSAFFNSPAVAIGSAYPVDPQMSVATTSASFSVTTSVRVLATTTSVTDPNHSYNRAYATVCTASANPVYVNLDGDKAASVGANTFIIAAAAGYDACYELTGNQMKYSGSITASSTNQTATVVTVKDYVY